jgi:hypothetical protein
MQTNPATDSASKGSGLAKGSKTVVGRGEGVKDGNVSHER